MTPIKSSCIVCSSKFMVNLQRQKELLPILYDDFGVFCQFFYPQNVRTVANDDKTLWTAFSFCSTCKTTLDNLCNIQGQLMTLQKEIAKISTHLTRKISRGKKGRISTIVAARIKTVRHDIFKHYKPRVVLSDCSNDLTNSSKPSSSVPQDDDLYLIDEIKDEPASPSLSDEEYNEDLNNVSFQDDTVESDHDAGYYEENDDPINISSSKSPLKSIADPPVTKINGGGGRRQEKVSKTTSVEENLEKGNLLSSSPVKTKVAAVSPSINAGEKEMLSPRKANIVEKLDMEQTSGQDTLSQPRKRRAAAAAALDRFALINNSSKNNSMTETEMTKKPKLVDLVQDGHSANVAEDSESEGESDDDDDDDSEHDDRDGDWTASICFPRTATADKAFKKRLEKYPDSQVFPVVPTTEPSQFQYGPWRFEELSTGVLGNFKCMECDFLRPNKSSVIHHINSAHILKKSKPLQLKAQLDEHGVYHYGDWTFERTETGFKCLTCSIECSLQTNVIHHINKVHNKNRPTCTVCEVSFSSEKWLRKHKCRPLNPTTGRFTCMHVGDGTYMFRRKWMFSKVVDDDGITIGFKCGSCDTVRKSLDTMTAHIRTYHSDTGSVVCEVCGYLAKSSSCLKNHQACHHRSTLDFVCEICARQFKTLKSLKTHKFSHRTEKFQCDQCDKSFQYEGGLKRHRGTTGHKELATNTQESARVFECSKCNRLFMNQTFLDHHRIKCYGKSIFPCLLCDHVSTTDRFLEAHMTLVHNQNCDSNTMNSVHTTTTTTTTTENIHNTDANVAATETNNEKQDCEENSFMDLQSMSTEQEEGGENGAELQGG